MITTGTRAEIGQECRYIQRVDTDQYGRTSSSQEYVCKTAPREIISRTEYVEVQPCLKKVLFGGQCDPYEPAGDGINKAISVIYSMGILN